MSKEDIKKAGENVKDAMHEAGHEAAAKGEHLKREAGSAHMDTGEKAKSVAHEATDDAKAGVDKAKQVIRGK